MQFKHPEILYALFLLLIPIIVHLFQLRKFQKTPFTNVALLKEVIQQSRKSSQIKKWLILITRMLLIGALVIAFAQPYTSKNNTLSTKKETVIYLDNSFSMQAKGQQGELLKRAVNDIINSIPENNTLSLITNDQIYKHTHIKAIKKALLKLDYTANKLSLEAALLTCKTLFSNTDKSTKDIIFISDFQNESTDFNPISDTLTNLHFVKLQAVNKKNIAIDSVYISKITARNIELKTLLKNYGTATENVSISLFNNNKLIAKTSVDVVDEVESTFTLPANQDINGKVSIEEAQLEFDNSLYFSINNHKKINVLGINAPDDSFLERLYPPSEFNYTAAKESQLNYNTISSQNLIILNELDQLPPALVLTLNQFITQGGHLLIIPSKNINTESYNQLLVDYDINYSSLIDTKKLITTINYGHPLYNNRVFEKKVLNFQYPTVNRYYKLRSNTINPILQFEDKSVFLGQSQRVFVFAAPLQTENSNFKNTPLIVPTLYNIAKQSFKTPKLYHTIGKENTFEIETQLGQNEVVSMVNNKTTLIPEQQSYNNKVVITTSKTPNIAGTYSIKNKNKITQLISYNYDRSENDLVYTTPPYSSQQTLSNSITHIFDSIKSNAKVNALWKWFVIFALALLMIEMLILKFFK